MKRREVRDAQEEEALSSLFNSRGTQVYVAGSRRVRVDSEKEVRGTGSGLPLVSAGQGVGEF